MNITSLIDRHADATAGAAAVIGADGVVASWSALRSRLDRLAGALAARGIGVSDRVALLAPNGSAFFETTLAVPRLGAYIVPLNYRLAAAELRFQLQDASPKLLIVDGAYRDLAAAIRPDMPVVGIGFDGDAGRYERWIEAAAPIAGPLDVASDHTFGIFYTGGTTGLPKGVMLTHGNFLANSRHVTAATDYRPADVHLHAAPMFHLADLGATFAQLYRGGAHVFLPQFRADALCHAVQTHRVTTMLLAPTMIETLVRWERLAAFDLSSWRIMTYGGSPITEATLTRCLDLLPCALYQGYGQTEATHTICLLRPEEHRAALGDPAKLRRCGRPIPGMEVRIGDRDDVALPTGRIGEVLARGPIVMKGYWNRPQETSETLRGGWLHTGDLGFMDAEGYVTLVDRKKDMIVTGAENVYSAEVESALSTHAGVSEVAVIAVPDDAFGERVHAVIVPAVGQSPTPLDLQTHCRRLIAGYKIPRSFEFVASLPKTAAGKVQKSDLRAPHWRSRERAVN
ncbi:MAG: long-chain-fatty-acid--CoA ligase [Alphaproteobacteria bacterium]